jgi:hypothetical protein
MIDSSARARLEPLLAAARAIKDATTTFGERARERLIASSGLSPEGVNFAIFRCLEADPSEPELEALIRSTPRAQIAHVLLSANVFVAAHRAIAIGLAASETVHVRASRREPHMAELLLEAAPGAFRLVNELTPQAGDRVWAYGSDRTLEQVAVSLPPGVALHAHGSGFGVAVLDSELPGSEIADLLPRLAEDIALFDQRGCLSPRLLLLGEGTEQAREIARALALELTRIEQRIPRGRMADAELAEITVFRDTASFAGELFAAGLGFVSVATEAAWSLPPIGRNLQILPTSNALKSLAALRPMITSCAFAGTTAQRDALRAALPGARLCSFGNMQTPPFDGPVDRRDS